MRLLTDQDVYAGTIAFLRTLGHDVVTAAELGLSRAGDTELLKRAGQDHRIFITRDKDFGNLVFVGHLGRGVVLLRIRASTMNEVHAELKRAFDIYTEAELQAAFVVIEPGVHRYRRLPG